MQYWVEITAAGPPWWTGQVEASTMSDAVKEALRLAASRVGRGADGHDEWSERWCRALMRRVAVWKGTGRHDGQPSFHAMVDWESGQTSVLTPVP